MHFRRFFTSRYSVYTFFNTFAETGSDRKEDLWQHMPGVFVLANTNDVLSKKLILLLITALMWAGSAAAQYKEWHGDGIDDYLRYVPFATAVTMKAAGVEGASSWKRFAVNSAISYIMSVGVTYGLKETVHKMRPDGSDNHSFPSGHTSTVFTGAMILHKEYYKVSPWISVAGFGVAALTAADRVRRNRHDWGDVLTGAAIGIAAAEAGYRLGDLLTGEHSRYSLAVGASSVALCIQL